jgi:hypothetical protein
MVENAEGYADVNRDARGAGMADTAEDIFSCIQVLNFAVMAAILAPAMRVFVYVCMCTWAESDEGMFPVSTVSSYLNW